MASLKERVLRDLGNLQEFHEERNRTVGSLLRVLRDAVEQEDSELPIDHDYESCNCGLAEEHCGNCLRIKADHVDDLPGPLTRATAAALGLTE